MGLTELAALFQFQQVSPLELVVRGTLTYWFLFLLFRFVLRRDAGSIGLADILLLVVIADASQNAMAGPYQSVAEGAALVSTIAAWNWLMDWAGYRWTRVRRFLEAPSLALVRRGRILHRNLRREMISREELMAAIRQHGVDALEDVKSAQLESDGAITVIARHAAPPHRQPAGAVSDHAAGKNEEDGEGEGDPGAALPRRRR